MENLEKNNKDKALLLLKEVENLAAEGNNQKQIAKTLGFKTTFTLNNRLVKASQLTGNPIPPFKQIAEGEKGSNPLSRSR